MKYTEWYNKASNLHQTCCEKQKSNCGSKKMTTKENTILNELQHAIGSDHGIHQVTYNEARTSLDEMFDMVKSGRKFPPLVDDRVK